jgi:hypothetical protein
MSLLILSWKNSRDCLKSYQASVARFSFKVTSMFTLKTKIVLRVTCLEISVAVLDFHSMCTVRLIDMDTPWTYSSLKVTLHWTSTSLCKTCACISDHSALFCDLSLPVHDKDKAQPVTYRNLRKLTFQWCLQTLPVLPYWTLYCTRKISMHRLMSIAVYSVN